MIAMLLRCCSSNLPFYFRDFALINDSEDSPPIGDLTGKKTAYIFSPQSGVYSVIATGNERGIYHVKVRAITTSGEIVEVTAVGVSNLGSASTYQIAYSSTASALTVVRVITFESTLDDINNSSQLGLINNDGIANSLSHKIDAAADAARRGQIQTSRKILGAFKDEVTAQEGKHISALAAQLLREDAGSLLSELRQ